jgi:pantothenate kinase type III
VVPKKNREIKRAASGRKIIWLMAKIRLNVRIDYPNPRSIGADRLANAVAVAELYGSPAIVIDFGTAVTFDIVAPGNAYIGGVIAPGLEAMTNFLYHRTALLPCANPEARLGNQRIRRCWLAPFMVIAASSAKFCSESLPKNPGVAKFASSRRVGMQN